MVWASGRVCIDELPYPNRWGEPPMFGLSAVPEPYLKLDGKVWDAEALCAAENKRVCTWNEWQSACEGTREDDCPDIVSYIAPDWALVTRRQPLELLRLDQHASPTLWTECKGRTGARMMGNAQEWVRVKKGHAFSRGFWSRPGGCHDLNTTHNEAWHDYATTTRCCRDL